MWCYTLHLRVLILETWISKIIFEKEEEKEDSFISGNEKDFCAGLPFQTIILIYRVVYCGFEIHNGVRLPRTGTSSKWIKESFQSGSNNSVCIFISINSSSNSFSSWFPDRWKHIFHTRFLFDGLVRDGRTSELLLRSAFVDGCCPNNSRLDWCWW